MSDGFSLLETMRLDEGQVPRLDRHIARMGASARQFEYRWDEPAVRAAVAAARNDHPTGCWRLRLLVDREGIPTVECTLHMKDASRVWRVAFARAPVDERDPFLFNKTTRREMYDNARRAEPDVDDVILWNRRGEVTESTIANVVVEIDGVRYTPPVACGLLGGTFRAELVDADALRERVMSRDDVRSASRVWLINSLREWVEARLVSTPNPQRPPPNFT
jgi:para-aminobenzoate synthetase / 4-amino-4-deoxychorismate lyase